MGKADTGKGEAETKLSPVEFAVLRLGMTPYEWQAECLEAFGLQDEGGPPVAIVAANGSGKTANIVAPSVLWFLHRYPRGQVVVTSGSFRQVEKQLFPALKAHRWLFPEWTFLQTEIKTNQDGFAVGFSTDDPGRAEGWHPKIGEETDPVCIIVDESKTVPDGVFEAFDRCTRKFQLWVSSPGAPRGQFYEAHHSRAANFFTRKVRSDECPHIDAEKRERDLQTYGEDHPVFRSMHLAEFTSDNDRLVIDSGRLARALDGQPDPARDGEVVAFCDFAAGRDENVLALRRGNTVEIVRAWRETDTVQACRTFAHLFQEHELRPAWIWGDADGLGTVMIDQLSELGWRINRFHGGKPSTLPDEYANLIGEVWHVGVREIERGRIHLGTLDQTTFQQISSRRSEWASNGKLRVEPKDSMAKHGLRSPDRADALLGAIACGARLSGAITGELKARTTNDAFKVEPIRNFGSF